MSLEKNISEKKKTSGFEFRVDVDETRCQVTLWDGADAYTFMLRNNEPYVKGRPGERDISKEKWRAMMAQAGAILRRLEAKISSQEANR